MYRNRKLNTLPALLIALLLTLLQAAAFAQTKKPTIADGVYDTKDWAHPITIKLLEGGQKLSFKDYKGEEIFSRVSGQSDTYVHGRYTDQTIRQTGTNTLLHEDAGNGYKREFILYSPSEEEPVAGVQKFEYLEDYFYFKTTPSKNDIDKFKGVYKYEYNRENGEPIIDLRADQTGDLQLHNNVKEPVTWWIETDYKGGIKEAIVEGGKRYHIVIRYEKGAKFEGDYRRLLLDEFKDDGRMVLLRERVKVKNNSTSGSAKTTTENTSKANSTNASGAVSASGTGNNAQRAATTPVGTKTSTPSASAAKDMVDYKEVAKGYQAKMKSDPEKAQVYSFCAAAAVAKSSLSPEAFDAYAKRIAASLKTLLEEKAPCPCADVISAQVWKKAAD
jgi:hypothetical protein